MTDVFTKSKRSEIMSRIRGKDNLATEKKLAELFRNYGIKGWRRNYPIFGKPDFVFAKERIAVFVDGEFWHGHPTLGSIPKTNQAFWLEKIMRNKERDRLVNKTLKKKGWIVVRIWQSQLKNSSWLRKISHAFAVSRKGGLKLKEGLKKVPIGQVPF